MSDFKVSFTVGAAFTVTGVSVFGLLYAWYQESVAAARGDDDSFVIGDGPEGPATKGWDVRGLFKRGDKKGRPGATDDDIDDDDRVTVPGSSINGEDGTGKRGDADGDEDTSTAKDDASISADYLSKIKRNLERYASKPILPTSVAFTSFFLPPTDTPA
jgi:hypothetical protein